MGLPWWTIRPVTDAPRSSWKDDRARAGVVYLYNTPTGVTRAIPFFVEGMVPGEEVVITDMISKALGVP